MSEQTKIELGTRADIELIAKDRSREKLQLVIVADQAANFDQGFLGISTPLAQTIIGHGAGETLDYPRGDILQVNILSVQAAGEAVSAETAEQRDQRLRRARDKAELANMVSFALTFDSKWGDYDPEQIVENFEDSDRKSRKDDA
jgi:Transcription elongation factor, GreA/GreB, C-term